MKPFLIVAALLLCSTQADAACSCNGCQCGPVCRIASEVREHKPVRRAVAKAAQGIARVALFPVRALRGCE